MSGFDYFKTCLVDKFGVIDGRARRSEYWYFVLFNAIITYSLQGIGLLSDIPALYIISIVVSIALLIPGLTAAVRRLHDINKSGWNYLWVFTGIGAFVVLYWLAQDSQHGPNNYGPNPKGLGNENSRIGDQLTEDMV